MSALRAAALIALLLTPACRRDRPEPPVVEIEEGALPLPPPIGSPIMMAPNAGPPGTEVTLEMDGLMMDQPTEIGFGTFAGHEIIDTMRANMDGEISMTVRVPASAAAGTYYFFVAERNGAPVAVSDSFVVTAAP